MRITTLHDVFRSEVFGVPDLETSIGPWFHGLISPFLTRLGHSVSRFSLRENGIPRTLIALAEQHHLASDHTGWTWLFSDPRARDAVAAVLVPLRDADMVIGFELSPNIIRALTAAHVRFLDVTQDAVRFCPDLFLRIRGNDPALSAKLAAWEVLDNTVRAEAAALRARLQGFYDGPPAVLFAGQVDIDSSLIAGQALVRVDAFIPKIEQILRGRKLLLKPHPMHTNSHDLVRLYEHFPEASFTTSNIYALLASPAVEQIITLSSSVAVEAPMFGTPALRLIEPDTYSLPPTIVSRFHRVDARFTSAAFWGGLLHCMPGFMFAETPPPPLRARFSVSWGHTREMITPVSLRVAANEEIGFAAGERGPDLCVFGWSDPEPWGLWSDGPLAMLRFFPPDGVAAIRMDITLAPYVPDRSHPLMLTLNARSGTRNDTESFTFRTDDVVTISRHIRIPPGTDAIELTFRCAGGISPHQLGVSDDQRVLGVSLRRMTVVIDPIG